ncbi:MAG: glycosyltransferase family 4 protein [Nanoarchaeota archaeon]|nr:glycosyltransferase family 4 protein [Nanoarchaeota archaeon]
MSKKIIYWVQGYRPYDEAISKEIKCLHKHFSSLIINPINGFKFTKSLICFNFKFFPLGLFLFPFFEKKAKISHIYTSLGNYFYLKLLKRKPIVLTAAGPSPINKIRKCLPLYKKLNAIVVETEKEKNLLLQLGVKKDKIKLIYPGIDLTKFKYNKKKGKFTILFASAPLNKEQFHTKGVPLIIKAAKKLENIDFILLWRGKYLKEIKQLTKDCKNIKVINKRIKDMNKIYSQIDATILPLQSTLNSKSCPQSILESLACGKPVLVSNRCGIANLINKNKCGVVFKINNMKIVESIKKLKNDYKAYQQNCPKTAKKYFDKNNFLKKYAKLYEIIKT